MKTNRTANLHMRVDEQFKARIEAAANKLDIPPSAFMRMALREYIERHAPETLREQHPTGYTAPPPAPPAPPSKKPRNAIAQTAANTSFYVVTRKG